MNRLDREDEDELLAWARSHPMSAAEREEQARSFAYGNVALENPRVTRALVDRVAEDLLTEGARERKRKQEVTP